MNDLQMTNQDLSQRQSMEELANQLTLADHLVYKKYLPELQSYSLVEPSEEMKKTLDVKTCIKLFQMKELTLKKGEDMLQKLSTVYHSSMALGCSLAVMIDVPADGAPADIYLGVRQNPGRQSIDNRDLAISGDALEKGMKSNFPGSEVQELHQEEIDALLEDDNGSFGSAQSAIASVSCVAALQINPRRRTKHLFRALSVLSMQWMAMLIQRYFWQSQLQKKHRLASEMDMRNCIARCLRSAKQRGLIQKTKAMRSWRRSALAHRIR